HQDDAPLHRVTHRLTHRVGVGRVRLAEAHVDDVGAVVHRVADAVGDILVILISVGDHTHRHDLHRLGHTVEAQAVAPLAGDDPGHVGAVAGVGTLHVVVAVEAPGGGE